MNALAAAWYRLVAVALARLHYRRITLLGREYLPRRGAPVLYVALHRNGAIDGAVYAAVVPRLVFLIAARLRRSPIGRLLFGGITVERAKDLAEPPERAGASGNAASLARSAQHVAGGGALLVFPEGTSDLGPRHLPFQTGAARIATAALAANPGTIIVPLSVLYFAPECFRSDAVVVAGPALDTALDACAGERERVAELHRRITAALEALAVEARDAAALARIERLAALGADGRPGAYRDALATLARRELPGPARAAWKRVCAAVDDGALALSFGAPAFSRRGRAWSAAWLLVQAPIVAAAALANALPVAAAVLGARQADARNTVAFFRALFAFLALVPWVLAIAIVGIVTGSIVLPAAYVALTAAGLALYPELRRRVAVLRSSAAAHALQPFASAALDGLSEIVPSTPMSHAR